MSELSVERKEPEGSRSDATFIGRREELAELALAHRKLSERKGKLIVISGVAGVGKTRLADYFARQAAGQETAVVWANCWERDGSPPYWHWVQLLRQSLGSHDKLELCSSLGVSGAYLGKLAPDLEEYFSARANPVSAVPVFDTPSSARERFKLFDSIGHYLRIVTRDKQLVAIFDDLQAADIDSLALLHFVASEIHQLPVLLIGVFRSDAEYTDDQRKLVAGLEREGRTLNLEGLRESEVKQFARSLQISLPASVISELYQLTDGNPFFLEESLQLLGRSEKSPPVLMVEHEALVSERIRTLVHRRLEPLSDRSLAALKIAAVIGREFELELLSKVLKRELPDLLDDLAEPLNHQLLEKVATGSGRYRFAQAMIAETISSEIPRRQLQECHREIGETLERLFDPELEAVMPRLAFHYLRAESFAPEEKALKYALRSAVRALDRLAYEETERLATLAISSLTNRSNKDPQLACELYLVLGEARNRAGKTHRAQEDLFEAAAIARKAGHAGYLAKAALKLQSGAAIGGADRRLIAILEDALGLLDAKDRVTRARLLAKLASCLYWTEKREQAAVMTREAVHTARETNDVETLIFTLFSSHYTLWGPGNLAERLAISAEVVELSERYRMKSLALRAHEIRIADLLEKGEVRAAESERETYRELANELREEDGAVQMIDSMTALLRGNLKEAEEYANSALRLAERWQHPRAFLSYAAQVTMIRYEQGRLGEMQPLLQHHAEIHPRLDLLRTALALASVESGNIEQARIQFEYFATDNFAKLERNWNFLATIVVAAEVCVFLKDIARGAVLYQLLLPYEGRNVMLGWYEASFGAASRALGMLATLCGKFDRAEKHFEDALRMNEQLGAVNWVARAQENYASLLLDRSAPGDRNKALNLIKAALDTARAHDLGSIERRLTELLERLVKSNPDAGAMLDKIQNENEGRAGTVTLLFSDIVHSTKLVEALGDLRAQALLREHDRVIRAAIADYNGREIKTLGDGFMVSFGNAEKAVRCAIQVQRSISKIAAPDGGRALQVRIGLHTGEPLKESNDFFGKAVIVAARISAEAAGGEILVSSAVKEMIANPGDLKFEEGHEMRLKGLDDPYWLHRVVLN
jgi:eukaryotic-like serine/threonine-protein kinase